MPSITRVNLPGAGAAKITYNSAVLWTRGDVVVPLKHALKEQVTSMYGRVTKTREGRMIEVSIPLYGFWANLSVIFPSYFLNNIPSARMFGTSDTPMTLLARNGDQIVINNCQITKVANLKLAANQQVFAADVTFTGLISNNTAPSAANSYYTISTGVSYAEGNFPEANFKSLTWTGAWGARSGFTTILTQEGWTVDWEIKTTPDLVDGIGPVDMFTDLFWGKATCIPVGPTLAQLDTAGDFQGANAAVGADISSDTDNLVLTDGASTLTLYACSMIETGLVFGPAKKRIKATSWESTRLNFTAGAPPAIAVVA